MKKLLLATIVVLIATNVNGQVEKEQKEKPLKEITIAPMGNFFASADIYEDKVILSFESTNQYSDAESFLVSKDTYKQMFDIISQETFEKEDSYEVKTLDGSIVRIMFRKQMMCYNGYVALFHKNGEPHILNKSTSMSKSQMRKLFDVK
ncbi:hypothetical protein IRZ71_24335 [Flavobacterium sp. ANB]|uniref:hypothetical protein n=1 Tax=unclassified Flavobacterium TaxID=196869 RepID=UPI0012BA0681|nr:MULTISPECIES: hypothetical protein [unclassified Flavobacterium]MBF4519485.1 hypothetical protein [Flavobacterium sp. ANB]MTD72504.1 hypothetical protein [Flavobacterium sp. LC2016-13]